jgi:two-component sensor histidine kinase
MPIVVGDNNSDTSIISTPRHVLVVDDDNGLRDLIVRSLLRAHFDARGVGTGDEAITVVKACPETVLVLDQNLTDMTGRDLLARLAEQGINTPFIMMTGQGDERLAVEMMKLGAADYLLKDMDLIELLPAALDSLFRNLETEHRLQQAEHELRQRLAEKEVLLREVHHRVKNNLAIIASLLNLQAAAIQTPEQAIEAFKKSRDRILAMAMVHQRLYASENCTGIAMQAYLEDLSRQLMLEYGQDGRINLRIESEGILLDVNMATPMGIILNELIANALHYAFPNDRSGNIVVRLVQLDDLTAQLTVADDGIGLPQGCGMGSTLGFTLVQLLAEQLGGTLDTEVQDGTRFRLRFPQHRSGSTGQPA